MPSLHEIKHYLSGLWLLARGDAQGLRRLDISDRGMMRSFWAFVWCLPAMLVYWNGVRLAFIAAGPPETKTGAVFFIRLFLIEAVNWVLPLVLVAVLCLLLGTERKFPAIVVMTNWVSVPLAYAYALLTFGLFLMPSAGGVIALIQLALLIATIFAISRILRQICGPEPLVVSAVLLVLLVPGIISTDLLQAYLGVSPY
jgi:hypothetical protein